LLFEKALSHIAAPPFHGHGNFPRHFSPSFRDHYPFLPPRETGGVKPSAAILPRRSFLKHVLVELFFKMPSTPHFTILEAGLCPLERQFAEIGTP